MSKRTAKFVSAIFASLLAGTPLATVSHSATDTADSCLSGPKGALPPGGHWYYRIDRATKRHCWYIADEKEKLSRAAPEDSSPSADSVSPPVSPPKNASTQRSIANARAELPLPQTGVEQETDVFTGQRPAATAAAATSPDINQRANAGDASAQRSVVASRWPELADVSSSTSPAPSAGNSTVRVQQTSEAAVASVPLAAADASSEEPAGSVRMLLIAIVGALAFAGLIASAIFRFGGTRRAGRRKIRVDRRTIWDSAGRDRPSLPDEARAAASMREVRPVREVNFSREPRAADDPNERIAQMLARLARSAAT